LNGFGVNTWFKVETKDGKTLEYGNDQLNYIGANFSKVYWQLKKITDTYGNYVEFNYNLSFGQLLIDEINYTGNTAAGVAPYNKVKFTYAMRQDPNTVYVAGAAMTNNFLLTKITSTNEGATVSEYAFTYGFNGLYSFLTQVEQYGSDKTQINPTFFKYGDETDFKTVPIGNIDGENYDIFPGDFDGDGFTDIMRADRVPNTTYHNKLSYFKNNNGTFTGTPNATTNINGFSAALQAPINGQYSSKYSDYLASDANGDGKDDIVVLERQLGANSLTSVQVYSVFTNSIIMKDNTYGVGFSDGAKYFDKRTAGFHFLPGDFNGDGKMDYITILKNNSSNTFGTGKYFIKIALPTAATPVYESLLGTSSAGFTVPPPPIDWQNATSINIMDFDGDGKQDVLVNYITVSANGNATGRISIFSIEKNAGTNTYSAKLIHASSDVIGTTYSDLYFGDFNGDRKADIVRVSTTPGQATIAYSDGKGFVQKPFNFQGGGSYTKTQVGDFNGDGASDIMNTYDIQKSISTSTNPDTLVYAFTKINVYYFSGDNYQMVQYSDDKQSKTTGLLLGDFNGDGRTDGLPKYGAYVGNADLWLFKPKGQERLLQKIANGYKHTTEIKYNLLTEGGGVYTGNLNNSTPLRIARFPLQVVSAVTTPAASGDAATFTTTYAYENATIHNAGRGFLGFEKVTESKPGGFKSCTQLEFVSPFYVPMVKLQTELANNTTEVGVTYNLNTFVALGKPGSKRYWKRVEESTSRNLLKLSTTRTTNTYDTFGNLLTSTGDINYGLETTTITNSNFCNCGSWLPSRPQTTVTTNTRDKAKKVSKTITSTFNATTGALLTTTDFATQGEKGTTTYSNFNLFGQPQSISVSSTTSVATGQALAQSPVTRTSSVTYDPKGRFIIKKTNALGQTNSVNTTFDSKWGKPLTETTSNNLTTTYEYDGYGRAKKVTMPEGYSVTTAYLWDVKTGNGSNTADVDNSIYYTYTQHPGRPDTKTWYDVVGRERKTTKEGWNNKEICSVVTYDALGRPKTKSLPFYTGDVVTLTTVAYNNYGLPATETNSIGTTTYSYNFDPNLLYKMSLNTYLTTSVQNRWVK
jgi:YD repeat-containing protein